MARIKIRQRADGGQSYAVQWVLGGGSASAGRKSQSETFNSHARALTFKADVEQAGHQWPPGWVKGEGYVRAPEPVAAPQPSFAEVAESYFQAQERRVRRGLIKPYQLQRDRRTYEIHLEPSFAAMALVEIGPDDVSDWIDVQLDLGASPKSIANRHGLLSPIMTHGQARLKLRPDNPCAVTELPQRASRRDFMFFQEGEWAVLRNCLRLDARLICDTLLSTAVRWGELAALRIGDMTIADEQTVHLHVQRAWAKRAATDPAPIKWDEGENRSWQLFLPKSRHGRHVTVVGETARALIAEAAGRPSGQYLFHTREGNPWRYPDFHADRWKQAVHLAKQSGLAKHATIHMLRHTAVVHALARGVDIYKVSSMLGHSTIQTTYDIYGGMLDLHDPAMAQAMAQVLMSVSQAITPAIGTDELQAMKIRPGGRGVRRVRTA